MRAMALLIVPLFALSAADKELTIYLTANTGGRFPLDNELQHNELMRLAAYLRSARQKNPAAYHIDLGNAFFPGKLSRFSYGSLTADYLEMLRLDAGLVAGGDLSIGAESLDYIRRARGIRLLSANIIRDKSPFFEPYTILQRGGVKTAVLGITSNKSLVNYAEAQLLALHVDPPESTIAEPLAQIALEKPDLTLAMTGLQLHDGIALLSQNPQIDILLCGGDAADSLGKEAVRQIELPDGRRVIAMPKDNPLMRIVLRQKGKRWLLAEAEIVNLETINEAVSLSPTFERRLSLWQKWYANYESTLTSKISFAPFRLTPQFAADSLRVAFGCDVAFVEDEDIEAGEAAEVKNLKDIRYAVQNDYDIFTFRFLGAKLREFYHKNPKLIFSGMTAQAVTGYPIRDNVSYRLCATQRGYEYAMRGVGRPVGRNQWMGISDAISRTLEDKITEPDKYADSRFRFLALLNLSNVYETGKVVNASKIDTPPGQAADSYFKWGLENDLNFMIYNRRHSFSFNPYIFYVRQMDQIIRNLLRGDITYIYNTEWYLRPYQKSRLDTVVVPVKGQRPSFLRETLGAEFSYKVFTGRLGGGLEKEILDPVNDPNWGFEMSVGVLWPLYRNMQYKLALDAFSSRTYLDFWRHRVEITNSLIFALAGPMTFTISHRWYYFYLGSVDDFYNSSILTLSLDVRTTWKEP
jgi:hypothetical protein